MPIISSLIKKIQESRSLYRQLLFVTLAFALMVVSSGIFVNNMLEENLKKDAENRLAQTEIRIIDELRELETLMIHIVKDVRDIILNGGGIDGVQKYYNEISAELVEKEDGFVFSGIHGYFDAEDVYVSAPEWAVPNDYNATVRPWYKVAVEADGKITTTSLFTNYHTGLNMITSVCRIFDDEGKPLGVVAMGIRFDNIRRFVADMRLVEGGGGILANENYEILVHPDANLISKNMSEIANGPRQFLKLMEQGVTSAKLEDYNYLNVYSVFYFKKLDNGWVMWIMTPKNIYYRNLRNLMFLLSGLGIVLMLAVNITLVRIDANRNKAQAAIAQMEKTIEEKNRLSNVGDILNSLDTMIYVSDPDTNEILFINNNMKQHYNIKDDVVGQICYKILQKDMHEKCNFCPCFRLNEKPDSTIVWEEHSTLSNRVYRNTDRYIDWPNGKKVHLQHSIDITDMYESELKLVEAKDAAEQSNRSKGIFLAHMSHEIRTPMNAILGISEIQLQSTTLSNDIEEAFREIYDSGSLLLNIINDILDFSKIEAGKLEIVPVKYNIPSLLNDTVQLNMLRYESKALEFKLNLDEKTPYELFGDELRIKQIMNNLLSNAFKYTDKGEIRLSVYAEQINPETMMLILKVSDTGQGMNEEQIKRLFDEYSRFNMETNRTVTGTGLGMNIVKGLIEMMGGEISVESEAGKGSTFTVRLPQGNTSSTVCGAELANNLRNFRFHNVPSSKKAQIVREFMPYGSVMVVDDVASNLYVAKGLLTPYGLKIETAKSGVEAIEKIKAGGVYDVVFMDHMMPGMDGIEATKIIREMGYTRPIVALTANAVVGQMDIFLANGFDDFIPKPIDSRQLNAALNTLIRDKQPREVIEATRREQQKKGIDVPQNPTPDIKEMLEIYQYFILDAENAINVTEGIYEKLDTADAKTVSSYITAVHGMKNVLANIGETELSAVARKLEQAGNEKNFNLIKEETPAFNESLKSLIKKHKPANNNETTEISSEDTVYLKDKLLEIKTACEAFDSVAAKNALDDLKKKAWTHDVNETLDEISVHLLHSAFKKAVTAAENAAKK